MTLTPMMAQWQACKKNAGNAILFFRLGDFYEAFHEDAQTLAKELDLTLTKRHDIPMSGVPFHSSDSYIDRLVAKGYRVAIAEQMEDPKQVKGIVKRDITRIITPGTVIQSSLLSDKSNNFLAAISQLNAFFGLAIIDITTGQLKVLEVEDAKDLLDEIFRLDPKEILISEKAFKNLKDLFQDHKIFCVKEEWYFDGKTTLDKLLRHFQVQSLDCFGLKGMNAAIPAAGALFTYLQSELNLTLDHIQAIERHIPSEYMAIDRATQKHLEILTPLHDQGLTLLSILDQTVTPMGGRLLKHWLIHPLLSVSEINKRQDAVQELLQNKDLYSHLKEVRDLERLIMRIETGFASARDLVGLRLSLEHIPMIAAFMAKLESPLLISLRNQLQDLNELTAKIKNAIVDAPPLRIGEGGIFKEGYNAELDELRTLRTDSYDWMARYQTELREKTSIRTLKVGFTKAFGYYIEVSRGQVEKMPEEFQRRQTLVNGERFTTPILKEFEYKVLHAEEKMSILEGDLFHALRKEVAQESSVIRKIASAVAEIDCLLSFAEVARVRRFVRPKIDANDRFFVEDGRHPVIESALAHETFIPNDIDLDADKCRLMLITGPNMAGKSTFIRMAALIAIMAQTGCFVPAKKAEIGIVDKVFSRIGASDDLSRGQSTFMVEMAETANILRNCTSRSLVILDEIGRGTSTYDGIAIAWAVAEYLLKQPEKQAKTLFATHYSELTELEKKIPGAINFNIAVQETEQGIVFLHKIVKGSTDKSYGVHVAKLAGLPYSVIKRAGEMLGQLEKPVKAPKQSMQLSLFDKPEPPHPVVAELKQLDPERMTPIDALRKIAEWKNAVRS